MRNPLDLAHLFADINLPAVLQQMDAIPMEEGASR
jgi:hypothetical protein